MKNLKHKMHRRLVIVATRETLLEINNLEVGFRFGDVYHNAVDDVSITLKENEILAIVGESGSGKSTLATAIIGLHDPNNTQIKGEILYKGLDLTNLNTKLYNRIRDRKEHTSELQSRGHLVCRLLLEKKKVQELR